MRCCECFPGWQRRTQSDNYEVMGRSTQVLLKTERMKKEWGGGGAGRENMPQQRRQSDLK